jgi:UDP-N-acetylglucosamine 4-epimerase
MYNTAGGERTNLLELINILKIYLSIYDPKIKDVEVIFGRDRNGNITHYLANISLAYSKLSYNPLNSVKKNFESTIKWFIEFKNK